MSKKTTYEELKKRSKNQKKGLLNTSRQSGDYGAIGARHYQRTGQGRPAART